LRKKKMERIIAYSFKPIFFTLIILWFAGCTPNLYLQNTNNIPKEQVVVLELAPSWKIGTVSLKIDGTEIPKKKGLVKVYLLPGRHEIEEQATGLGKCIREGPVRYMEHWGTMRVYKTRLQCIQYEYVKWIRRGELVFDAGYAYDFPCHLTMLPVVAGRLGESQKMSERYCRSGENILRKKID
jgi:hypothetical protein